MLLKHTLSTSTTSRLARATFSSLSSARQLSSVVTNSRGLSVACTRDSPSIPALSFVDLPQPALRSTSVSRFQVTPLCKTFVRPFSSEGKEVEVKVPHLADSITSADVQSFVKAVGDIVEPDEVVASLETDKVSIEVRAPERGKITQFCVELNAKVKPGDPLFKLVTVAAGAGASAAKPPPKAEPPKATSAPAQPSTSGAKESAPTQQAAPQPVPSKPAPAAATTPAAATPSASSRTERRVPMNRMRQRIAERLKDSQNTYALLTTFQEVDMFNLMNLRETFQEEFTKKHGVKLGFMSAFVKASAAALQEQPIVNAVIDGTDIVYRDYVDISVAVATPKGLVVPVLRNCQNMSFADVEKELGALGQKAKADKISIEDMTGGSFTISNGGVYGSLMGTPIINPPQSAILGMHGIVKRPVVLSSKNAEDQIVIRPIMYLALTYDHRLIDGREAVTFLRSIKANIEDPRRLLLNL